MKFNGEGPVVGIDIDGTLGDYHGHFIKFAEMWIGRQLPSAEDVNPALPFSRFLGISKPIYRQIKLAYRQGGMKRSMPCYPGARELTVGLRRAGCEVWICTSRPFNQLGNVDSDTRHWLRRNGIQYDNVLWGERKYISLRQMAGDRVVAILEDLPKMVEQSESCGIRAVLRDQPYNRHMDAFYRALDLDGARIILSEMLSQWKDKNK